MKYDYDLLVIGGGPGGLEAATFAGKKNLKTALITETPLGGRANWGSLVPSKAWLASAQKMEMIGGLADFAFSDFNAKFSLGALKKRITDLSKQQAEKYTHQLKKAEVTVLSGKAILSDVHTITLTANETQSTHTAKQLIFATGSGPRFLPDVKPNGDRIIAPRLAKELKEVPPSLVMIGAGVTGSEYAYAFNALGTKVTLITSADSLLPRTDHQVAEALKNDFQNKGIDVRTKSPVTAVVQQEDKVMVTLKSGETVTADYGFIAIGRKMDLGFLNDQSPKLPLDKNGAVNVNQFCQTEIPSVYAVGDVTGFPMTANRAMLQARIAVNHILNGENTDYQDHQFIEAVFANPNVAQIGVIPAESKSIKIITKSFSGLLKANLTNHTDGFIKIWVDKPSGFILAASAIGEHATDLLAIIQVAINNKITYDAIAKTPFAYPAFSEIFSNLD